MSSWKSRRQITKEKSFPCEKCQKNFTTKFSMQRHSRECGVAPNRVNCTKCNKSLKNMDILEKHQLICFGLAKKVICNFCDELFSSQFSLRRHLWRFHQNEELPQQQDTMKEETTPNENNTGENVILNYSLPKAEPDENNHFCYYYMDICYDYEYLEDEDSTELDKPVIYPPEEI